MAKFFVIDTNVLVSDPDCIWKFEDGTVIIPMIVIEELDKLKKFSDDAARSARKASKNIDELRSQGSLIDGVPISPGIVKVCQFNEKAVAKMPAEYKDFSKPDNIILAIAFELNQKVKDCILVTKDVNMRIKGDSLGIKSEDYESDRVTDDVDSLYKGVRYVETTQEFLNNFYTNRKVALSDDEVYLNNFMPNEFIVYKTPDGSGSAIGRFHKADHTIKEIRHFKDVFGIRAKNLEQQLALDLLFDDNIKLVTLAGPSGTGKTVISIAAALQQTLVENRFDKIIISRSIVPIGKDIGALPGPQPLDAKILTPNGWTTMGQLKIGSEVISRDGKPTKVLGIFPKGEKDVYRITTNEGASTECCLDHLWFTKSFEERKRGKLGSIKSTNDILNSLKKETSRGIKNNHFLPRNEPVEFHNNLALPLPAYTIGALLGDGSITDKIVIYNSDKELIDRLKNEASSFDCELSYSGGIGYAYKNKEKLFNNKTAKQIRITNLITNEIKIFSSIGIAVNDLKIRGGVLNNRCNSNAIINNTKYEFLEPAKRWQNNIKDKLYNLGLLNKKAPEKFIPNIYKYSSINDRIDLLRGLMDTDGTIKKYGEMSFCTTSLQLANDIIEIVKSLGGRAVLKSRNRIGKTTIINNRDVISKEITYEFNINLPNNINPFYISRKAKNRTDSYMHDISIDSIKYIGKKKVQCILVENNEHLYLTDDFIVTHNTKAEKLDPWISCIRDNIDFLCGNQKPKNKSKKTKDFSQPSHKSWSYSDRWFEEGLIEMEAITYMRGRSLPNCLILIDECQNISLHELKTILTRAGDGAKICLLGDCDQVDSIHLNSLSNGLTHAVEKFKNQPIAGHVMMTKGERSELATISSKIL